MKIKVLPFIIITSVLLSMGYMGIKSIDASIENIENSDEILQVEQDNSNLSLTNSAVSQESGTKESTTSQTENQEEINTALIEGVPHIQQMPELARGCEVTSLAMLLQYAGVSVDKMTLAREINKVPFRDQNGVRGNPNDGFVGDVYSFENSGYGVYHGPIAELAENYLPSRIIDLTGEGINSVYNQVNDGYPVWVITNSRFSLLPEEEFSIWDTNTGKVQITYREHSVLVVGYDENYVYLNDPLADKSYTSVPRASFEASWIQMGGQAISYR